MSEEKNEPSYTEDQYIFHDSGVYRLPKAVFIGTQSTFASALAEKALIRTGNLFETADGYEVDVARRNKAVFADVALPDIVLNNAPFKLCEGEGEPYLTPIFETHVGDKPLRLSVTWTPPKSMRLHFGVIGAINRAGTFELVNCYLFATHNETWGAKQFYLLPLPNTYTDGRVCMGNGFCPAPAKTLSKLIEDCVTQFRNSAWNADLLTPANRGACESLFRFNPATLQPCNPARWSSGSMGK